MAKRNKPAGGADDSQNELDFERSEDGGTIDAPAGAAASPETGWPRLEKRPDLDEERRSGKAIPPAALPSPTLGGFSWDAAAEMPPSAGASMRSFRIKRVAALAATVALSAALGALAGSMITNGLGTPTAAAHANGEASTQATLARMEQEMTGLRLAVETAARDAHTKTTRIAERLDRTERAQAEPLAKLAKISETVERLERRGAQTTAAAATAAPAGDVTGSIGAPRIAAPDTKAPTVVSGWRLHEVQDGMAVVEGRAGFIEVFPGDTLPKLGRVEAIRKQDGRWVVVTSRGLIVDR